MIPENWDDIRPELILRLTACGLSEKTAERYILYHLANHELGYCDLIPYDDCFLTLSIVRQLHAKRQHSLDRDEEMTDHEIFRFLQVPYRRVEKARAAIFRLTGFPKAVVDELYGCMDWYLLTADQVERFFRFLEREFSDLELVCGIFVNAALLGLDETQKRITCLRALLGAEYAEALIRQDTAEDGYLFYRFYTDPVGCIGYMLERGMTPEQVLHTLAREPLLLYAYKQGRRASYGHDQAYIDKIIGEYL